MFPCIAAGPARLPLPPDNARIVMVVMPVWTASPCQLPASRPAPSVQARKGAGRGKNPFLFAMLFEKNIESFSERQPVGVMSFLLLPPAFPSLDGDRNRRSASRCRVTGCRWSLLFGALGQRIAVYQRCLYSESGRRILCRRKLPCRIWHHL